MAVFLSPVGGAGAQFCDNNGNPLNGGKLYTYLAGTTTPAATYTSSAGVTFHPNPIILNAGGRVPDSGEIWLADSVIYKFVLKTSADVLIATWDQITGINSNFVNFTTETEVQTATAGQTVFTLTTMTYAPGTGSLTVYVDGVNQYEGTSYLETDGNTVTFTAGLHVGAEVKFTTAVQTTGNATSADVVSYVPPFTNSVGTTVEDKLAQYVSVKDFGAVGDGVTDDADAFNLAKASGALYIYVPEGTYKIQSQIDHSENDITWFGPGVIELGANDMYVFNVTGSRNSFDRLHFKNSGNYTTTNFSVFPQSACFYITGDSNKVSDCTIENFINGVIIVNQGLSGKAKNNLIQHNQISVKPIDYGAAAGWPNDAILTYYSLGTVIRDNLGVVFTAFGSFVTQGTPYTYCRGAIVSDAGAEGTLIEGNVCGEGFLASVHNESSTGCVILRNQIYKGGVASLVGGAASILFNTIYGPAYNASVAAIFNIAVSVVTDAFIEGNIIQGESSSVPLIQFQNTPSGVRITKNMLRGAYSNAINGVYDTDLIVEGNKFEGNYTNALNVGASGTGAVVVADNIASGTYVSAVAANPIINATISGNNFSGCSGDNIVASGDSNYIVVTGNDLRPATGVTTNNAVTLSWSSSGRNAIITGNLMVGHTYAVAAQFSNFGVDQIVTANLNNTTEAI